MTPAALARENGSLKASAILDIITDAMRKSHLLQIESHWILKVVVISIPVILLLNVRITLRRKLALWGILCLSIFTKFTAIIKLAGGNISHGQIDSAWVMFWLQAEAAVAVIVVSITAFRALFVAHRASKQQPLAQYASTSRSVWSKSVTPPNNLPAAPSPSFTGVRTYIRQSPYDGGSSGGSQDIDLPLRGPRILVTQNISSEKVRRVMSQGSI